MNAILIPFFLAVQLASEENTYNWQYGPQYTFQVYVNATAVPETLEHVQELQRLNLAAKLLCQPKDSAILSCALRDSRADSFYSNGLDAFDYTVPEEYDFREERFELKFHRDGLEALIVEEDVRPQELDMLRALAAQLNFGINAAELNGDSLRFMENFTQGECETLFKIDRYLLQRDPYHKPNYEIKAEFNMKEAETVEIRKIRNMDNCNRKFDYFFGSSEAYRKYSQTTVDTKSSDSRIVVSPTEFSSTTSSVITTMSRRYPKKVRLYENITLRLESVVPAESNVTDVGNAASADIFVGRWLRNDSSSSEEGY